MRNGATVSGESKPVDQKTAASFRPISPRTRKSPLFRSHCAVCIPWLCEGGTQILSCFILGRTRPGELVLAVFTFSFWTCL